MKSKLLLLYFFVVGSLSMLKAQPFDIGVSLGVSNYMGDLIPSHVDTRESNMAVGVFGRYSWGYNLAVRGSYSRHKISGSDKLSDPGTGRRLRNLSFQSVIHEISVTAEYNILDYDVLENRNQFAPFVFIGIGVFHHNPKAYYNNEWVELRPLGTEGQLLSDPGGMAYSQWETVIPFGAGCKILLSEYVNLGIEFGFRKTFTDYLDDVSSSYPDLDALREAGQLRTIELSYRQPEIDPDAPANPAGMQRGQTGTNDWYMFSGITLSFNFGGGYDYGPNIPLIRPSGF